MGNYQELLKKVEKTLKLHGFKKKGTTFYFFQYGNWGLINFQTRGSERMGQVAFTINLGVSSTKLNEIEDIGGDELPSESECHWRERIGWLLPEKKDHWWDIESIKDIEAFAEEIVSLLTKKAIPEIMRYISDESLLESLISNTLRGLSEFQRWQYLVSLASIYRNGRLEEFAADYWEYATANRLQNSAKIHLKSLGIAIPR